VPLEHARALAVLDAPEPDRLVVRCRRQQRRLARSRRRERHGVYLSRVPLEHALALAVVDAPEPDRLVARCRRRIARHRKAGGGDHIGNQALEAAARLVCPQLRHLFPQHRDRVRVAFGLEGRDGSADFLPRSLREVDVADGRARGPEAARDVFGRAGLERGEFLAQLLRFRLELREARDVALLHGLGEGSVDRFRLAARLGVLDVEGLARVEVELEAPAAVGIDVVVVVVRGGAEQLLDREGLLGEAAGPGLGVRREPDPDAVLERTARAVRVLRRPAEAADAAALHVLAELGGVAHRL